MPLETEVVPLPGFYDPVSSISHLFGAGLFFLLGMFLIRYGARTWGRFVLLAIYVVSTVTLMAMSGVYHMLPRGETPREVMERLDRGAIFLLIAGSFTPIHGMLFTGWRRWGILFGVWFAAISGIVLTTVFYDDMPAWLGAIFYLALGWVGAISMVLIARKYGLRFILPLFLGGVAYSVGAAVDYSGLPPFVPGVIHAHEIFHVAILGGAAFHWVFIWKCVTIDRAKLLPIDPGDLGD